MPNETRIRPRLSVLTELQTETIHARSLELLSSVGVRVDSDRARRLLTHATGHPVDDDHCIQIPPELVEWAVEAAPSGVDLYDQRGDFSFRLGQSETRFGVGVTTLYYQDAATDKVIPFSRKHMETIVQLAACRRNGCERGQEPPTGIKMIRLTG